MMAPNMGVIVSLLGDLTLLFTLAICLRLDDLLCVIPLISEQFC